MHSGNTNWVVIVYISDNDLRYLVFPQDKVKYVFDILATNSEESGTSYSRRVIAVFRTEGALEKAHSDAASTIIKLGRLGYDFFQEDDLKRMLQEY